MGGDLSIILRPCVPVPDDLLVAHSQQPGGTAEREPGAPKWYTELRLVEDRGFNSQTVAMQSDGVTPPPPCSHVFVGGCTPHALMSLDLSDTTKYRFLHDELCCSRCAGRIGLVVDSSVGIGRRLYDAEQRHMFTQGFSLFLSKLAIAIRNAATAVERQNGLTTASNEMEAMGGLVISRPSSPKRSDTRLRNELFLVDLQYCMLDDVSGPWIVRDIMDHMGRVQHHHTAVSVLCSQRATPSSSLLLRSMQMNSLESSSSSRMLVNTPNDGNASETTLPLPDATQLAFCRSLSHVVLSHNNMSIVGLRKCLLELVDLGRERGGQCARHVKMIDVTQNEESTIAQRLVAELSSATGIRIVIGTSGMRWRHRPTSELPERQSGGRSFTTENYSLMHSSFEISRNDRPFLAASTGIGGTLHSGGKLSASGQQDEAPLQKRGVSPGVESTSRNTSMGLLEASVPKGSSLMRFSSCGGEGAVPTLSNYSPMPPDEPRGMVSMNPKSDPQNALLCSVNGSDVCCRNHQHHYGADSSEKAERRMYSPSLEGRGSVGSLSAGNRSLVCPEKDTPQKAQSGFSADSSFTAVGDEGRRVRERGTQPPTRTRLFNPTRPLHTSANSEEQRNEDKRPRRQTRDAVAAPSCNTLNTRRGQEYEGKPKAPAFSKNTSTAESSFKQAPTLEKSEALPESPRPSAQNKLHPKLLRNSHSK